MKLQGGTTDQYNCVNFEPLSIKLLHNSCLNSFCSKLRYSKSRFKKKNGKNLSIKIKLVDFLDRRSETNKKQNILSSIHLNLPIWTPNSKTDMAKFSLLPTNTEVFITYSIKGPRCMLIVPDFPEIRYPFVSY